MIRREENELQRRVSQFRGGRPAPEVKGRTVLLVDDGIATGGTTRAAIKGLRKRGAAEIVLAVPVASPEAISSLRPLVDDIVCLSRPRDLIAIGVWYGEFSQVPDVEVARLLELARTGREAEGGPRFAFARGDVHPITTGDDHGHL